MQRYKNPANIEKYKLFFCKGFSDITYNDESQQKIN